MLRTPGPSRGLGFEAAVGSAPGKRQQALEDALETFLSRLPSWRCGQRDVGRTASESPDRIKEQKEKPRRPSPVASSRKGNFDKAPGQVLKALPPAAASRSRSRSRRSRDRRKKDKDKEKEKEKDRDRRREREDSGSRDRKDKKKGKDKKEKEKKKRARSSSSESSKSRGRGKKDKSGSASPSKPAGGKGVPDWLTDIVPAGSTGGGFSAAPSGVAPGVVAPSQPKKEVIVPQQLVSRLIGKGGESIMGICHQTGADVKIRQETKEMGYSLAVITGRPECIAKAELLVLQRLGDVGEKLVGLRLPGP